MRNHLLFSYGNILKTFIIKPIILNEMQVRVTFSKNMPIIDD